MAMAARPRGSPLLRALAGTRGPPRARSIHEGPDTIDELLDRHLSKKSPALDDDAAEALARRRLTSSRREALGLYRDILRATRLFEWLLIGGRDAVDQALERVADASRRMVQAEEAKRRGGA